jgi:uncharacterized protein (TIRG00374 family)
MLGGRRGGRAPASRPDQPMDADQPTRSAHPSGDPVPAAPTGGEPGPPRRRLPAGLAAAGKWVLVAGALVLVGRLLAGIDWGELAARLAAADPRLVALAVGCLLARVAGWNARWWLAARRLGIRVGFVRLAAMLSAAAAVNHLTPAARVLGGVLRGRHLGRAGGCGFGGALGSVLYDQLAHHLTMAAVGLGAAAGAAAVVGRPRTAAALGTLLALGSAGAVWLRVRAGERGARRLAGWLAGRAAGGGDRRRRLLEHGSEAAERLAVLLADGRLAVLAVALGVGFALVNALAQWLAFAALGTTASFVVVLAAVSIGAGAGIVLGTPGGVGASEAAMIAVFVALGVDRLDATAATLLYRGLHYLVVLGLGAPALVWLEGRGGAGGRAAGADDPDGALPGETS